MNDFNIEKLYKLVPLPRKHCSTAKEYRFADGIGGEIGVITSMTSPFCSDCDRIRLTSDGKIIPCMFSNDEYDVKSLLRGGASDGEMASFIRQAFWKKFAGVESLLKEQKIVAHVRPMYKFGG